jgi:pimeloyl-ACP methyl ester carboxylesterase
MGPLDPPATRDPAVASIRDGRTAANGISIHYLESGPPDATQTLLFLHGGTGSARRHWSSQLGDFGARGYRCIAPDHRGHAGTTNDLDVLDQRLMAEDEASLLRALGIERAHVVGFSVGGVIGIYLALEHPDLVPSLTTIGSHMTIDEHVRASNESVIPERVLREDPEWAAALRLQHSADAVADTPPGTPGREREPEYWQRLLRQVHDTWEEQPDWTDGDLAALRCPALVGRGEHDDRASQEQIDRIARAIRRARTFVVPGAEHYFHTVDPGRSALDETLTDFLPPAR